MAHSQKRGGDEAAEEKRKEAEALEALADDVGNADSIAEDAPALSELFHEVRTSRRSSYEGRYVALLDHDEADGWSCRSVAFLESGTHYRETGADAVVSFKPFPFLSVDQFAEHVASDLRRDAQAARQSTTRLEEQARQREQLEEHMDGGGR